MALTFYNTLGRKKEIFKPLNPPEVGIYNCGPTVYDYPHIGNLRTYLLADSLRRTLEYCGYKVKQVINITDVGHNLADDEDREDKVELAAKKKQQTVKEVTDFYTATFMEDLGQLNIKTDQTLFPRASDHITEQIELIKALEERGFVYQTSDGLYFDTSLYPAYNELACLDLAGLKEGARIKKNKAKKNPTDFALWKFSKFPGQRLQEWDSPWGIGFPGWHIECSAMSFKYLGQPFDIHVGGEDHIPVHHTNEKAQSEAARGKTYVSYWLHGAHLLVDGKKMAKSEKNFWRLKDLQSQRIEPLAFRFWLLGTHYRKKANFTWPALKSAQIAYHRLLDIWFELPNKPSLVANDYRQQFLSMIEDDLNTPKALALVWKLIADDKISKADKKATLLDFDQVLGLGLKKAQKEPLPEAVRDLLNQREKARQDQNWALADDFRRQIEELGFKVFDSPTGSRCQRR